MNILNEAKSFGCHDLVILGDEPTPRHLDYLDLLNTASKGDLKVDAVAEFQARPLLYIVSGDRKQNIDDKTILDLQWLLANRGERAYVGIMNPGELNVYPVNLDRSVLAKGNKPKTIKQEAPEAPLFFQSVVSGSFTMEGQPEAADYVFKTIHDAMTYSSKDLIGHGLNPLDVLSFLGRALFFRFLCDRKIVKCSELASISPQAKTPGDCFRNVESAVATCKWLDETFNGDLLPLSDDYSIAFNKAAQQTNGSLFKHLCAIMEGWDRVGVETFQLTIDWGDLDFAHIPIGVLSQVYENFSRIWDKRAEETSVYYTPKDIARYLVDDAFEGIKDKKNARILDPSCGAGIFLVLAFRKLVAARWEHDGKRPDTKTIQSILYNQICGFDISESALRLAALSLYITAIELNGTPRPPKSLKFPKPLQGVALYNHKRPEEEENTGFVLGSLWDDLSDNFNGSFDMVIGNPPWSRLTGKTDAEKKEVKKHNVSFTKLIRKALNERGLKNIAKNYQNPDNNPDLPFLWKATLWAKPDAIIAMVLPARIFLKQSGPGTRAFNAILKGLEITGILNGSNLSDSKDVWPDMGQPFMLFFARNRVPDENHYFHFVTPHFEKRLNDKGRIRIDYQAAQPIAVGKVIEDSNLLKILAVGTFLDVEIVHKINAMEWPTVKAYWKKSGLYTSKGYDLSAKQKQEDASFLRDLPNFSPPNNNGFSVNISLLPKFKFTTAQINPEKPTAHRTRDPELYKPPLLIVSQSPSNSVISPKSWMARNPIAFRKKFYGYSAYGCEKADGILALLYLLTHSMLFRYHALITSSIMGAERRSMTKSDLDNFPFPEINALSKKQYEYSLELSNELENATIKPWQAINNFIFDLYELDEFDRQVISDTLDVAPPYKEFRDRANSWPTKNERKTFYDELQRLLAPSFTVTNETVSIDEIDNVGKGIHSPWHFFTISSTASSQNISKEVLSSLIFQITREANKTGCSRAIIHEEGLLLVGIIGQYRYWTLSRARLCAMDIIRNHLVVFPVGRN
ncbi:MAG: N-6 DNA methylase [Deltaproteobacteria bacterium]|nr:N-6 DNA methylase [Deltaproteobacteria bacterium]